MKMTLTHTNKANGRTVRESIQRNPKSGNAEANVEVFQGEKLILQETFGYGSRKTENSKSIGRYAAKAACAAAGAAGGAVLGAGLVKVGLAAGAFLGAGAGLVALGAAGLGVYCALSSDSIGGTTMATGVATGSLTHLAEASLGSLAGAFNVVKGVSMIGSVLGMVGMAGLGAKAGWNLPDKLAAKLEQKNGPESKMNQLRDRALAGAELEYLLADKKAS
jgi:hypothetical protein